MSEPKVDYDSGKGRPPKDEEEKRDSVIKVYLTEAEKEYIEVTAGLAGMPASVFLRELGMETEISPREDSEILKEIRAKLGRMTAYGNQIAKKVNQGEVYNLPEATVKTEEEDHEEVGEFVDFRELMVWLHNLMKKLDL